MSYQVKGVIKEIHPLKFGSSESGEWSNKTALIEETNEKGYKTELILVFWNKMVSEIEKLAVGEERTFHFNLKSRKSGNAYFTEASVWKITQ